MPEPERRWGVTLSPNLGLTLYRALALFPLLAIFCFVWRRSPTRMGLRAGRPRDYVWAAIYPIAVIGAGVGIAMLAGGIAAIHCFVVLPNDCANAVNPT